MRFDSEKDERKTLELELPSRIRDTQSNTPAKPWEPLQLPPLNFPNWLTPTPQMLVGERQRRLYPLDPQRIDYIEADKNYVTLWVKGLEYISRDSIKRLSMVLKEFGFVRIDRSVLVNIRAVLYAQAAGRRAFAFTLTSGACLHSSATYRDAILRVLPLAPLGKRKHGRTDDPT